MSLFPANICHLTFTHSDCFDVLAIYQSQMRRYFNSGLEQFYASNVPVKNTSNTIIYTDSDQYPKRLYDALEQLKNKYEYVFFDHEDMFLYAEPKLSTLSNYFDLMLSEGFDHIRMIKNEGALVTQHETEPSLFKISMRSNWVFSIQPGFWKIKTFQKILEKNFSRNIWELEVKAQNQVKKLKISALYSYSKGAKRGLHHYDNDVYPYVATAIGKGQWNFSEYREELAPLLQDFGIDPSIRGVF
ncbi:MAG: hypothetical protein VW124_13690 [Paracoccaceae bacterium]